jgi:hypothetical protein
MGYQKLSRTAGAAVLLLGLIGCGGGYGTNVGVGVAYVDRGPPRERVEIRSVPPGRGYVWVRGYWRWTGGGYDWVSGRWEAVGPGRRSYRPGRWRHNRQGWYWVDGRWH